VSDRSNSFGREEVVESIGAYLAKQRRIRGISAEQLADITRIPLRSIERFEAGHFDADLDGFSRGFVRTVAEALGLDPNETLTRTLREPVAGGSRSRGGGTFAWGRVLVAAALLGFVLGVGLLVREGLRLVSKPISVTPNYVLRRDPVRDLAEAQGAYVPISRGATPTTAEALRSLPRTADSAGSKGSAGSAASGSSSRSADSEDVGLAGIDH
jgi:hypothetical protein